MRKIVLKPKYMPLVQMSWHCAPCCIQWILLRRNLKLYDQEHIGKCLNLKVPKKLRKMFSHKIGVTSDRKRYGVRNMQLYINKFFKEKKIPLKSEFKHYDEIKNHAEFIAKNLKKGNDILFCFNWKGLGKSYKNTGHCCLISEIILDKNAKIVIGDPSWYHPKFWEVELKNVINAMNKKYDGIKRGFFVISKR